MTALLALLEKELTEQWRSRQLPVVGVIFLLVGLGSPVLARYTPEIIKAAAGPLNIPVPVPTLRDAVAQLVKNLGQVGVLTAILLAMGSIAREKENGTAAFLMTKPVSRGAFLLAKFSGLAMTIVSAVGLSGAAAYLYTSLLFSPPPALGLGIACGVIALGLLEIAAVTFLASSVVGSPIAAAGLGVMAVVVTGLLAAIPEVARYTPFGLNKLASDLALQQVGSGWGWPLLANAAYVLVALGASWLVFRRQEL